MGNSKDLADLKSLLRAYARHVREAAGAEHICLESYEAELQDLPGPYPLMLLARIDGESAGCVLLKSISTINGEQACEMKRLWVEGSYRASGMGRALAEELLRRAKALGFTTIYLDTIPDDMPAAFALYQKLGFETVPRYNANTIPGVQFFRRRL